jgi:hypothetical protein
MSEPRLSSGLTSKTSTTIRSLLIDEWRFLTFRPISAAVGSSWKSYLAFGLFFTWLAGVGRYWDNTRAYFWQHLGFGSVAYVFVLSLIIWALLAPLRPKHWSYRNVLLFITLTAPPALLYAIPVEKLMSLSDAATANVWFLALVAAWRVVLYVVFLRRTAGLSAGRVIVGTALPLTLIVVALAMLNLEHVVFDIMGGLRADQRTANDGAYGVVFLLSVLSILLAPVLIISYIALAYRARHPAQSEPPKSPPPVNWAPR